MKYCTDVSSSWLSNCSYAFQSTTTELLLKCTILFHVYSQKSSHLVGLVCSSLPRTFCRFFSVFKARTCVVKVKCGCTWTRCEMEAAVFFSSSSPRTSSRSFDTVYLYYGVLQFSQNLMYSAGTFTHHPVQKFGVSSFASAVWRFITFLWPLLDAYFYSVYEHFAVKLWTPSWNYELLHKVMSPTSFVPFCRVNTLCSYHS